ncbi:MAG: polynucleotide kinase-phosphatase [bacterium]
MQLRLPKLSLVVLIGTSGSGKSTFAKKHFLATEIISSDYCRALVSDDENNQRVTDEAFELLHYITRQRLKLGKLTVIDATNVRPEDRKELVAIAREYHALPVAVVFFLPEKVCQERNKDRADRDFGPHVIRNQRSLLRKSLKKLKYEGFRQIFKLVDEEQINTAQIERVPLWNDKTDMEGPFDIIGDVHGCYDELIELLENLGYQKNGVNEESPMEGPIYKHTDGRCAIFLGDIVDRGPRIIDTIKLVCNMIKNGSALCVPGNHDMKLMRKLMGKDVQITYGLAETLQEIDFLPIEVKDIFVKTTIEFLGSLVSHYLLNKGKLVVSHAGIREEMQGRGSGKVREFCLYGETTGETDEFGLPIRYNWALDYTGKTIVVYGHTPVPEPEWLNRTINIDTGCVFGGKLTALRYPEKELIQVPAKKIYAESKKPFQTHEGLANELTLQQKYDDLLVLDELLGKKFISTRFGSTVNIRLENASAALEVMSRFAVNPKWIIYLPPTMSPSETSNNEKYLEYPLEAFDYFKSQGIPKVICEQKHMGSRAVVIVCKNEDAVRTHFGIENEGIGIVYTRTGRRFFKDDKIEHEFLSRIRTAISKADYWNEFKTEWFCLDCELMPWSEKAQELLKSQYAAVGAASTHSLTDAVDLLERLKKRTDLEADFSLPSESGAFSLNIEDVDRKIRSRQETISAYINAYREYCWTVNGIKDLKLAPFHILATEKKIHSDKDHLWHMENIVKICDHDTAILLKTPHKIIDVTNEESIQEGCVWWEKLTARGFEGMVVKPLDFIVKGKRGLIQPAIKCRGKEYLRIIYGPEYTLHYNLERLKARNLGIKRSLALREFALGLEGLERFVRKEPLRRVHECAFGVLALESEPVDPRL